MRFEEQCLGVLSGSANADNSKYACAYEIVSNIQPAWSVVEW